MRAFTLFAAVLALGLSMATADVEAAKRLGGGSSSGMQRQMNTPDRAPAAAPAQNAAPTAGAAGTAAQPKRSWMGPVAGLAAGLGLAALASHLGFGEELASMLMIGLLVMVALALVGFIMRKRAAAQAGGGMHRGMQYAAASPSAATTRHDVVMPAGGAAPAASAPRIPAGFDVAGFARQAKVNFIRLQAANDAGNLDDIREFTTPEMFAELRMNLAERGEVEQHTDVVSIEADVLEVVEEDNRYIVSVRYTGFVREDASAAPEAIDEVWHLVRPREGKSGWLLAGIQQLQ